MSGSVATRAHPATHHPTASEIIASPLLHSTTCNSKPNFLNPQNARAPARKHPKPPQQAINCRSAHQKTLRSRSSQQKHLCSRRPGEDLATHEVYILGFWGGALGRVREGTGAPRFGGLRNSLRVRARLGHVRPKRLYCGDAYACVFLIGTKTSWGLAGLLLKR